MEGYAATAPANRIERSQLEISAICTGIIGMLSPDEAELFKRWLAAYP